MEPYERVRYAKTESPIHIAAGVFSRSLDVGGRAGAAPLHPDRGAGSRRRAGMGLAGSNALTRDATEAPWRSAKPS